MAGSNPSESSSDLAVPATGDNQSPTTVTEPGITTTVPIISQTDAQDRIELPVPTPDIPTNTDIIPPPSSPGVWTHRPDLTPTENISNAWRSVMSWENDELPISGVRDMRLATAGQFAQCQAIIQQLSDWQVRLRELRTVFDERLQQAERELAEAQQIFQDFIYPPGSMTEDSMTQSDEFMQVVICHTAHDNARDDRRAVDDFENVIAEHLADFTALSADYLARH
ncbi:hypothetical protein N7457_002858 [Penicillium paradoxum]|uniref:uncharacterized protein n=1 Tax=Penicillium paradoxum TaxID=176176 RepID=UPI002548D229|nr:uncharacterized protein N7457_002858 [Penicillium paradoxum]KAJ5787868.1 hypothetical protein N7457_002858 [Penicillium paradoxum]